MKYILITGGVCSKIEKGAISCCIGQILRGNGYEVTFIKIDPYDENKPLNVCLLNSVEKVPSDLSGSERLFYKYLNRVTTSSIFQDVITKEREGKFLGKTVQVVPHITNAIQEWIERVAHYPVSDSGTTPQVCILEFGGTVDDFESRPFAEALRQFKEKVGKKNFCCVHVSFVPQLKPINEYNTKGTQSSVMELRRLGLFPDVIVCKTELPVNLKEEISKVCKVPPDQVLCVYDLKTLIEVSLLLERQNIGKFFHDHLKLPMVNYDENFLSVRRNSTDEVLCAERKNMDSTMKYILVTGGVISGIGKGIISSSIGKILKNNGYEVTAIKIDPYINIDAGTFSPYEHGEVFVLDDGGEVDLDLGNYERFMDITLHKDNNITTGKIYQDMVNKERDYNCQGKTAKIIPLIQEWVKRVALQPVSDSGTKPQICIIELGGTVGDIESCPFVEAFCQLQDEVKEEDFCCVHLSLVPQLKTSGEHKTKPTQSCVSELRRLGLSPDLIVCRSELPVNKGVREKISEFCNVPASQVICLHDVKSIYHVPILLEEQNIVEFFHDRLKLPTVNFNEDLSREWRNLSLKVDSLVKEVKIALVGKYTEHGDAYASVTKALLHATLKCNLKLNLKFIAAADLEKSTKLNDPVRFYKAWMDLCYSDGLIVPGGFGIKGVDGKMAAIQWARKNKLPFLGICLGFQLAVVEFARNVIGWEEAHSSEVINDEQNEYEYRNAKHVVIEMPEHNTGIMGGTMRKGKKKTMFKSDHKDCSILRKLYGNDVIEERHRHRYEVNKEYVPDFERAGLKFVAEDDTGERLEILELPEHPYFVAVQFHPEYTSKPLKPSPPFLGLILASCGKLNQNLTTDASISPHQEICSLNDVFNFVNCVCRFYYGMLLISLREAKRICRLSGII